MKGLHTVFSTQRNDYRDVMLWAACCLAYFSLLRVSEFNIASPDSFNRSTDLLLSDAALDSHASPTLVQVTLKQCKNDQFRTGNQIFLSKTFQVVCPVEALVKYLSMRGGTQGPLFLLPSDKALTSAELSTKLSKSLTWIHTNLITHVVSGLALLHQLNELDSVISKGSRQMEE